MKQQELVVGGHYWSRFPTKEISTLLIYLGHDDEATFRISYGACR
jgi:hypothetical protein